MLIPAVSQLPLFVFSTGLFSSVATRPSPLDDEEFLTLTSLARPDPTGTLPVALGLVTLANVETARWFIGAERAARTAEIEARQVKEDVRLREEGKVVKLRVRNIAQSTLRGLSVLRIVIAVMVDGVRFHLALPFVLVVHCPFIHIVCACVLAIIGDVRSVPILGLQLVGCTPGNPAIASCRATFFSAADAASTVTCQIWESEILTTADQNCFHGHLGRVLMVSFVHSLGLLHWCMPRMIRIYGGGSPHNNLVYPMCLWFPVNLS